jgi:hypothetical protein
MPAMYRSSPGWIAAFLVGLGTIGGVQAGEAMLEVSVGSNGEGVSEDAYAQVEQTIASLKADGSLAAATRTGFKGREGERRWCVRVGEDRPVQIERVSRRFGQIRPRRGYVQAEPNPECGAP